MDYVELKKIIDKFPNKWNCNDVQRWLEFIGCEKYK